jgi:hypothetical protein
MMQVLHAAIVIEHSCQIKRLLALLVLCTDSVTVRTYQEAVLVRGNPHITNITMYLECKQLVFFDRAFSSNSNQTNTIPQLPQSAHQPNTASSTQNLNLAPSANTPRTSLGI